MMPNATVTIISDRKVSLEEAQEIVGGYVEIVPVYYDGFRAVMLVNEEGRLMGLLPNKQASEIAEQSIVGNVLLLTGKAKKGWA